MTAFYHQHYNYNQLNRIYRFNNIYRNLYSNNNNLKIMTQFNIALKIYSSLIFFLSKKPSQPLKVAKVSSQNILLVFLMILCVFILLIQQIYPILWIYMWPNTFCETMEVFFHFIFHQLLKFIIPNHTWLSCSESSRPV